MRKSIGLLDYVEDWKLNILRREEIKEYIKRKKAVSLKELSSAFPAVSVMTIHRDLDYLAKHGVISRIRGGAKYLETSEKQETQSDLGDISHKPEKDIVAQKAVQFVKEGSAIYLDAGTTMLELAKIIPDMYINVVTNGPNIALEIAEKIRPTINLCGGVLNRKNLSTSGLSAMDMLSKINIDVAFISASGYSVEGGFTCGFEEQVTLRHLLIEKARSVIILMDSTKIGKMLPYTFAKMEDINYLITDKPTTQDILDDARKNNVVVL